MLRKQPRQISLSSSVQWRTQGDSTRTGLSVFEVFIVEFRVIFRRRKLRVHGGRSLNYSDTLTQVASACISLKNCNFCAVPTQIINTGDYPVDALASANAQSIAHLADPGPTGVNPYSSNYGLGHAEDLPDTHQSRQLACGIPNESLSGKNWRLTGNFLFVRQIKKE